MTNIYQYKKFIPDICCMVTESWFFPVFFTLERINRLLSEDSVLRDEILRATGGSQKNERRQYQSELKALKPYAVNNTWYTHTHSPQSVLYGGLDAGLCRAESQGLRGVPGSAWCSRVCVVFQGLRGVPGSAWCSSYPRLLVL